MIIIFAIIICLATLKIAAFLRDLFIDNPSIPGAQLLIKLENNETQITDKRWELANNEFDKITNGFVKFIFKPSLNLLCAALIIASSFLAEECIQGNHPVFSDQRSGAICNDGWVSYSTGRGTCFHHKGVDHWMYPVIGFYNFNPMPYIIVIASILIVIIKSFVF